MRRAQLLTPWTGTGSSDDPYRPAVLDAYRLVKYEDVTSQPAGNLLPAPNLVLIEIVCTEAVLAAIEAEAAYEVLWDEPV